METREKAYRGSTRMNADREPKVKLIGNVVDTGARAWRRELQIYGIVALLILNPQSRVLILSATEESAAVMLDEIKRRLAMLGVVAPNLTSKVQ